MDRAVRERERLEHDLREAIDAGAIHVIFQPLADLRTNSIIGFSARPSWRHAQLGEIAPERLIAIAEDIGLINRLWDTLFLEACGVAGNWPPNLSLSFDVQA